MVNDTTQFEGRKFVVHKMDSGCLRIDWEQNVEIQDEDALEVVDALSELCEDKPRPLLVNLQTMRSVSKNARGIFGELKEVSRVALLVRTALSRTIGSFFIGLNRGTYPTRMFTDEAKALEWLLDNGP